MSETAVPAAIMQLIQEHGGIQGVYDSFRQSGLSDIFESWISRDSNQPVSYDKLSEILDPNIVKELADRNGIDSNELVSLAIQFMPMIIDTLTPDNKIPDETHGFLNMAINFLKSRGVG